MSRGLIFTLLIISVIVVYFYQINIQVFLTSINNGLKSYYLQKVESIDDLITLHFNQKEHIQELQKKVKELQKAVVQNNTIKSQLNSILQSNSLKPSKYKTSTIKVLSYMNIKDQNRLWVEFEDWDKDKTYGVIQNGIAVGIVTTYKSKPLFILNNSPKCNYSVFIGKNRSPAILKGATKDNELIANYISNKNRINIGDTVVTSGLDRIFLQGYAVGNVTKVVQEIGYKKVFIKPYNDADLSQLFYAIKSL